MIRSILLFLLLIELSPARARGFGQTERAVPNLPIRRGDTAELPCRQKAEKLLDETLKRTITGAPRCPGRYWRQTQKPVFGKPPAARMLMHVSAGVFIN